MHGRVGVAHRTTTAYQGRTESGAAAVIRRATRTQAQGELLAFLRLLRSRRVLPGLALGAVLLLAGVSWWLASDDATAGAAGVSSIGASSSGVNGAAVTGDDGASIGELFGEKLQSAPNVPAAAPSSGAAVAGPPALPRVRRAITTGAFPSGVNASTLTQTRAWAAFRGRPNDVIVAYTARNSWSSIIHSWIGSDSQHFSGFSGTWVVSVPLFPDAGPEKGNLASCAAGDYDTHWHAFGAWLVAQGRSSSFVRLGWEFNGDWFAWSATDPGTWISCFRHASSAIRAADPSVRIDWNLNAHNSVGTDAFALYPGDAYVDVIGVDAYDEYPASPDPTSFADQCNGVDGLCVAIRFARAHDKLFSVPEWGVVGKTDTTAGGNGGGDNPVYIQQMYNLFVQNADILAYEAYFSDSTPGNVHSSLLSPDENPLSAAMYSKLWSRA